MKDDRQVLVSALELRQLREQVERSCRRLAEMEAERRSCNNIAADTLRTPISVNPMRAGSVTAQRHLHMPPGGISLDDNSEINTSVPRAAHTRAFSAVGLSFADVFDIITELVTPFYGDSSSDRHYETVLEFVEHIERLMDNLLSEEDDDKRLLLVKLLLHGNAARWLNSKLMELKENDRTERDFSRRPLTWDDDVRQPFLYTFLGNNTHQPFLGRQRRANIAD